MRRELIFLAVKSPDSAFVAEMLQMPDPKPEDEARVVSALAKLY